MRHSKIQPTHTEVRLEENDLIVSKTDTRGVITYANRTFMRIAGFSEPELLGAPHNLIRHPDMPRAAFKLLWDTLKGGGEFLGYVKNLCRNGSYYWVMANITPDYDTSGQLRGYFSVRRKPSAEAVNTLVPIYRQMVELEQQHRAIEPSMAFLEQLLAQQNLDYRTFVLNLLQKDLQS